MVQLLSGKSLINTTIKYAGGVLHKKKGVPGLELFSQIHVQRVHSKAARRFSIWMSTKLLHNYRRRGSVQIIHLIWAYRDGLGRIGNRRSPTSLDMAFPLMYPLDEPEERNYEAKFDCLQMRLVLMIRYREACRIECYIAPSFRGS